MEKKTWLRFDSFKTPDEITALNSIDPGTVNISKPSTLSPMMGVDNAVISEFEPVGRIFDTMKENSAYGHMQNTNHQNMTKRRVGRNGRTNLMTINTLIALGEVGDEIKQVKQLSFLPTIEVENADYLNKTDTDDVTQKALRSHGKLKKEALPVVNIERFAVSKLEAGFKMIKSHDKLENE